MKKLSDKEFARILKIFEDSPTIELAYVLYESQLVSAAEYYAENSGYSHGSDYELMEEQIRKGWEENFPEWF